MADDFDLQITVGGDTSQFNAAMASIPASAQAAASATQAAFDSLGGSTAPATAGMEALSSSIASVGGAAALAAPPIETMIPAMQQMGPAAEGASAGTMDLMGSLLLAVVAFESLLSVAEKVVEEYGLVQRAAESLTAITGATSQESQNAIAGFENLANSLGFVDDAFIKMSRDLAILGVPLQDMGRDMQILADASVATGAPIEALEQKFGNMAESGNLMARSLATSRLSIQDIGEAMNMADKPAKVIQDSFKGIEDEATRMDVLMKALSEKFPDYAAKTANDTIGSWNQIKNAISDAFKDIGKAMDGFTGVAQIFGTGIRFIEDVVLEAIGVFKQLSDVIVLAAGVVISNVAGIAKAGADALKGDFAAVKNDLKQTAADTTSYWDNYLTNVKKDWADTSTAIDNVWNQTSQNVRANSDIIIPHINEVNKAADAAAKTLAKFNDSFQMTAQKALDAFGGVATGENTAESALSKLNSVIEDGSLKWDKLSASSVSALQAAMGAAAQLKDVIAQAGLDKLSDQIGVLFNKFPQQVAEMDASTLDFINSLRTLDTNLVDMKGLKAFEESLKNYLDSQKAADESTKQWFKDVQSGEKDVASFGKTMSVFANDATDKFNTINRAFANFGDVLGIGNTQLQAALKALNSLGMQTNAVWSKSIQSLQAALDLSQKLGYTYTQQLQIETSIYQAQLNRINALGLSQAAQLAAIQANIKAQQALSEATDMTGESELALAQKMSQVNLAQFAIHQQTMGLADAWNAAGKAGVKALDDFDTGIANAIVAGQGFAQVFQSIFKELETAIVKIAVDYIMKTLVASIIQATDSFAQLGVQTAKTAFDVTQSVTKNIVPSFDDAGNAVKSFSESTKTAMDGTAKAVQTSASSMVANLNLIATAVGAIASIFSAIELAHTNTLLTRIEESTRYVKIVTAEAGDSIYQTSRMTSLGVAETNKILWNPIGTLLVQINGDLDTIATNTTALVAMGGMGGGGGGMSADVLKGILDSIAKLAGQTQILSDQVNGPYAGFGPGTGAGGGTTYGPSNIDYNGLSNSVSDATTSLTTFADVASVATSTVAAASAMSMGVVGTTVGLMDQFVFPQIANLASSLPGARGGGITPLNNPQAVVPSGTASSGGVSFGGLENPQAIGSGPVPMVVNVTAGSIVGAGGVRELTNLVSSELVKNLGTMGIRITRV